MQEQGGGLRETTTCISCPSCLGCCLSAWLSDTRVAAQRPLCSLALLPALSPSGSLSLLSAFYPHMVQLLSLSHHQRIPPSRLLSHQVTQVRGMQSWDCAKSTPLRSHILSVRTAYHLLYRPGTSLFSVAMLNLTMTALAAAQQVSLPLLSPTDAAPGGPSLPAKSRACHSPPHHPVHLMCLAACRWAWDGAVPGLGAPSHCSPHTGFVLGSCSLLPPSL